MDTNVINELQNGLSAAYINGSVATNLAYKPAFVSNNPEEVIIGIEIAVMFPDPSSSAPLWLACVTNGISVGIGELISCTVLGVLLVRIIEASPAVRKVFES